MLGSVRHRTGEAGSICFKAGILRDMGASREPLQSRQNHLALRETTMASVYDVNPPCMRRVAQGSLIGLVGEGGR
jgi:hypothetical protein